MNETVHDLCTYYHQPESTTTAIIMCSSTLVRIMILIVLFRKYTHCDLFNMALINIHFFLFFLGVKVTKFDASNGNFAIMVLRSPIKINIQI